MSSTLYLIGTGAAAGVTAAVVAIGVGDVLAVPQDVSVWIGIAVVGSIGTAAVLASKKWLEAQVNKLVDLPTRNEIFNAIHAGERQTANYHKTMLGKLEEMTKAITAVKEDFQIAQHSLDIRVSDIEMRHETEDRLRLLQ